MAGWIKLHRKVLDCFIWQDKPYDKARAWIDLLLLAMHHDKKVMDKGNVSVIKRGSYFTSRIKLADRWGWSIKKVDAYLNMLEKENMVTTVKTEKGTAITIVNYDNYQIVGTTEDITEDTTEGIAQDTSKDIAEYTAEDIQNKNNKNIRNKEYKDNYIVSKDTICQTEAVRRIVDEWNTLEKFGIQPVKRLANNSDRYKMLIRRINEYSEEDVLQAIENIKHSKFLQGKSNSRKTWVITFDWFVRPNNFPKVFEGQYNDNIDLNPVSTKSVTDIQLASLAEQQRKNTEILSDEEIDKMFE